MIVNSSVLFVDALSQKQTTSRKKISRIPTSRSRLAQSKVHIIRIYRESGIEKSIPRIIIWHYTACRVIANGDPEEWIFLSHPHTNNGFFFLLTIENHFFIFQNISKFPNTLRCTVKQWRHFDITLTTNVPEFQYNQCTAPMWQPG